MKTLLHRYVSDLLFLSWIDECNFANENNLLLQLFCGITNDTKINTLLDLIRDRLPNAHLIGATTDGEIMGNHVFHEQIVIVASIFEHTLITTFLSEFDSENAYNAGQNLASSAPKDSKLAILFTTGTNLNGEDFIQGFRAALPAGCHIAGGMAGDNGHIVQTTVFSENALTHSGAVAAYLQSDLLNIYTYHNFAWRAIGLPMTITRSQHNRVYEIDHQSAQSLYVKYFGEAMASQLPKMGIEFPLIVTRGDSQIARACIHLHEDGSMEFSGNLIEGESVQFGIGDLNAILQSNEESLQEISRNIYPEAIFIYSCMAYRRLLKEHAGEEFEMLASYFPVCGFYTYGEFYSSSPEHTDLLNDTMTAIALSEKAPLLSSLSLNNQSSTQNGSKSTYTVMQAMTNMINVMASEWDRKLKKEIEKNLENQSMMIHQNKLAQMGEMIAMIAHQWRQPLNALSATAINLSLRSQMGDLGADEVERGSKFIQLQCQKMSHTIDTFIEFSKPKQTGALFVLRHTIDAVITIIEHQLYNHNINISVYDNLGNITLHGNENQFEQVILNLLSNARDAFDQLDLPAKQIDITIDISDDGHPCVTVSDNACGIPDPIREKIFNPYFTTKSESNGTGLGLYMSREIMRKGFRGDLRYTPLENGSRFDIIFYSLGPSAG